MYNLHFNGLEPKLNGPHFGFIYRLLFVYILMIGPYFVLISQEKVLKAPGMKILIVL